MTNLIWFRRDLRLHDHATLATALAEKSDLQPFFMFDPDILARFQNKHDRRMTFIAETLCHLEATLRKRGGCLLVFHGKPAAIVPTLAQALASEKVFCSEDFEPATRARDDAVAAALEDAQLIPVLDHLMRRPRDVVKKDGTPYKVFTPYYKVWRASIATHEMAEFSVKDKGRYANGPVVTARVRAAGLAPLTLDQGPAALLEAIGYAYKKDPLWRVENARKRLAAFIDERLADYPKTRDQLPVSGTSRLSPYLRHGQLSIRECMRAASASQHGAKWIAELAWREFYSQILYHFPEVVDHEFNPKYRGGAIPWSYNKVHIKAFEEGKTGFPVIDAAMRELVTTGYMHNRARMIVASFATKDLLLDWRLGEAFFAQYLMDYELASNNGGWQWGASTGTDASPYFRIFNPELQGRKFDPNGDYIRAHVPELRSMSAKEIHAPAKSKNKPTAYPDPIVDHSQVKDRVVPLFRRASKKAGDRPPIDA